MINPIVNSTARLAVASAPVRPADDPYLHLAERFITASGIEPSHHVLLTENLACNLSRLYSPSRARRLQGLSDERLLETVKRWKYKVFLSSDQSRYVKKMARDDNAPYTDAEVLRNLRGMNRDLGAVLKKLQETHPESFPRKLIVFGSVAKGYCGGNSDIDILLDTDARGSKLFCEIKRGMRQSQGHVSLFPNQWIKDSRETAWLLDHTRKIEVPSPDVLIEDDHFLERMYVGVLKHKGYQAQVDGEDLHVVRDSSRAVERPVDEQAPWWMRWFNV